MSVQATRYVEEEQVVCCSSCGDALIYSARRAREFVRTGRKPRCRSCRFPPLLVVTDDLLDWWTARFSEAEIIDLAEGMWGDRENWKTNPPVLRRTL